MEPEVLGEMLYFIYTGVTHEDVVEERAEELLAAAQMYQLDVLKNICEDHLCSTLEIDNSIEYLVLGDIHQAKKLRNMSMRMIIRNIKLVVNTEAYQDLVINHPSLVCEFPKAMVENDE